LVSKVRIDKILKSLIIDELSGGIEVKGANVYVAALIAQFIRERLLDERETFSFETVMSHVSKIELFRKSKLKGYRNYLYFVATESPAINKARVQLRIQKGGHPVGEQKIQNRYYRSLELLLDAITLTDRASLFDNSSDKYRLVAVVTNGRIIRLEDEKNVPAWLVKYVINKL